MIIVGFTFVIDFKYEHRDKLSVGTPELSHVTHSCSALTQQETQREALLFSPADQQNFTAHL